MEHIRQSRPDSGLGFQVKVFQPCTSNPTRTPNSHPQLAQMRWGYRGTRVFTVLHRNRPVFLLGCAAKYPDIYCVAPQQMRWGYRGTRWRKRARKRPLPSSASSAVTRPESSQATTSDGSSSPSVRPCMAHIRQSVTWHIQDSHMAHIRQSYGTCKPVIWHMRDIWQPEASHATSKTVKARLWRWLLGKRA